MVSEAFDPELLLPAETEVLVAVARGDWAKFESGSSQSTESEIAARPILRAAFLRHLILGLKSPRKTHPTTRAESDTPWSIASTGIRIVGAEVVGKLDLKDAIGPDSTNIPTLALENCVIREDICLDHAYLQRLSLHGSYLHAVSALEITVAGQVDVSNVKPYPAGNEPQLCWLNFDGARIDGDFRCQGAWLIGPAPRRPMPSDHRGRYALSMREAEVEGRFYADSLTAIGGVSLSFSSFRGEVWLSGASLIAGEKNAFSAEGMTVQSNLKIDKAGPDRQPFSARGCVWLTGANIVGNLVARGAQLFNRTDDGLGVAIDAVGLTVGGSCYFDLGFLAEGQVRLNAASIAGNINADGGQVNNRTPDGSGLAVRGRNAFIGGSCFLNNGFRATGQVRLNGVKISGNFDATGGQFINRTVEGNGLAIFLVGASIGGNCFLRNGFLAEGQILMDSANIAGNFDASLGHFKNRTEDGLALAFCGKNAKIGGYCFFTDGFVAEGEVNLADARIAGNLSGRNGKFLNGTQDGKGNAIYWHARIGRHCIFDEQFEAEGNISLVGAQITKSLVVKLRPMEGRRPSCWIINDATVDKIDDWRGMGWGSLGTTIKLDGLHYNHIDSASDIGHAHGTASFFSWIRSLTNFAPNYKQRLHWFLKYIEPRSEFSPQPYEMLAATFRSEGLASDARKILQHKRWRQWVFRDSLSAKPFMALFGLCFGFGYSPVRAILTFATLVALGGMATDFANAHGFLELDTLPVANVLDDNHEPSMPVSELPLSSFVPCGTVINPWLYATDVFIPLLDLHQESQCEPAEIQLRTNTQTFWGTVISVDVIDLWRIAKTAYALLGALVTSLLLLTFSGILQEKGTRTD